MTFKVAFMTFKVALMTFKVALMTYVFLTRLSQELMTRHERLLEYLRHERLLEYLPCKVRMTL